MPQEWVEVNIVPAVPDQPERLLVGVIDGLVHDTFADRLDAWFFEWFQEPQEHHLRLRLRWRDLAGSDAAGDELFARLDEARAAGRLGRWWEGKDGRIGEVYEGEQGTYGDLWELSYRDWNSSCELVLAMARQDPDNRLSEVRQREWNSRAHLHSNRMGWNYYVEALISLANARFYLAESGNSGAALAAFVAPIDGRIEQLINEIVAGPAEDRSLPGRGAEQGLVGEVLVVGQVLVEGAGGDLGVALAELVDQQLVRLAAAVVLGRVRVEQAEADPHVALAGPLAHRQDADVPGRGGRGEQREVERAVVVVDVVHAPLGAAELRRRLVDPVELGVREQPDAAAGEVGLEQPPDAVDGVELRQVERGHGRAAPGRVHHQALGLEHAQGVADRDEADVELVGQPAQGQALPGGEGASQDRATDLVGHLHRKRPALDGTDRPGTGRRDRHVRSPFARCCWSDDIKDINP
jgi:hypothetical protein